MGGTRAFYRRIPNNCNVVDRGGLCPQGGDRYEEERDIAMTSIYSFTEIQQQSLEGEDEAGWALWEEFGSRGLDIWVELPANYAAPDGLGGEPSGSYLCSASVGDYLATPKAEKSQQGCYTWLRYALGYLKVREED
jgi:hypothetical protein